MSLQRTTTPEIHQETVSHRTRREHDDLLKSIHLLEAALASPAPGRERQWAARSRRDLQLVRDSLERHIRSAEGPQGLFEQLDQTWPAVQARVVELRQEHQQLLARLRRLEEALARGESTPDFASLRREAAEFLTTLRRHHAREVDLIYECFWLDLGVGD